MIKCDMQPSEIIIKYVTEHILPVYAEKLSYKRDHIDYVIRRSLIFARQVSDEPIDIDMVYVIASYHDIGEPQDRKTHEFIGANMLRKDAYLQKFFAPPKIEIMAQAIEDHRASGKSEPRTVYGRIVSSADRTTSLDDILRLAYGFRLRQGMTLDDISENAYKHVCEKFGESGYALSKMYFDDPEYETFKKETIAISKDKAKFIKRFLKANFGHA